MAGFDNDDVGDEGGEAGFGNLEGKEPTSKVGKAAVAAAAADDDGGVLLIFVTSATSLDTAESISSEFEGAAGTRGDDASAF